MKRASYFFSLVLSKLVLFGLVVIAWVMPLPYAAAQDLEEEESVSMDPLDNERPDISDFENARPKPRQAEPDTLFRQRPWNPPSREDMGEYGEQAQEASAACRSLRSLHPPEIQVQNVEHLGGELSERYRVEGLLYGECVTEAGYYIDSRLRQDFQFPLNPRRTSRRFAVDARKGDSGEIRIINARGQQDSVDIDLAISKMR